MIIIPKPGSAKEDKVIEKIKEDPAAFHKYASQKKKAPSKIGPLKVLTEGKMHFEDEPKKMAEILSKQYRSVFSNPNSDSKINDPATFFNKSNLTGNGKIKNPLEDVTFSVGDIEQALGELKTSSAAGPDGSQHTC